MQLKKNYCLEEVHEIHSFLYVKMLSLIFFTNKWFNELIIKLHVRTK